MKEVFGALTRSLDGWVSRRIDQFSGNPPCRTRGDVPGEGVERVWALRYSVVSVRRDHPRLVSQGEVIEAGGVDEKKIASRLIRQAIAADDLLVPADEPSLRVHLDLLGHWRRRRAVQPLRGSSSEGGSRLDSSATAGPSGTAAASMSPAAEELLAALDSLGGTATIGDLLKQTGWSRGRVRYWLQRLVKSRRVSRGKDASSTVYSLVEAEDGNA